MANNTVGKVENIIVGAAALYISDVPAAEKTAGVPMDLTEKPAFVSGSAGPPVVPGESYRTTLGKTPFAATPGGTKDLTAASSWQSAGFTQEGLEVSYEPDFGDVEVDQLLDSAVIFKQSMRVSLNTTLAEATLFNLMIAWGQAGSSLTGVAGEQELEIQGGSLGEAPVERGFIAVGNSTRDGGKYGERVYHMYRTLNVESSTHGMKRNENTGIPVSFRALPANNGLYGKIKERKRTW